MLGLVLIPFVLQGVLIAIDEVVFHLKRGLPKWERIGHPIDTFTVLLCFLFVLLVPYSKEMLKVFIGLAIVSCFMVTKDEFVHKHHCKASENWLHAVLFLVHPIVLTCSGMIWAAIYGIAGPKWLMPLMNDAASMKMVLVIQTLLLGLFFIYQVIFWNFIWSKKIALKQ